MKKKVIIISTFLLFFMAAMTCPDRSKHQKAITNGVSNVIQQTMLSEVDISAVRMGFIEYCTPKLCEFVFGPHVEVRNYIFYSLGGIRTDDGGFKRLSFGMFGKVFFPETELRDYMKEYFSEVKNKKK